MIKLLERLFGKKKSLKEHALDIATDKFEFAGHTFKYVNPYSQDFIMSRRNEFFLMEFERSRGITDQDLIKFITATVNKIEEPTGHKTLGELYESNKQKLQDIKIMMTQLYFLMENEIRYKPLLKSACIVILIDDEKPDDDFTRYMNKKLELCEKHPEIRSFFLAVFIALTKRFKNNQDIIKRLESLEEVNRLKTEEVLLKMINSTLYEMYHIEETENPTSSKPK